MSEPRADKSASWATRLVGIVLAVVILALLAEACRAGFGLYVERGRRKVCIGNLEAVGRAINTYESRFSEPPSDPADLLAERLVETNDLVCPSAPSRQTPRKALGGRTRQYECSYLSFLGMEGFRRSRLRQGDSAAVFVCRNHRTKRKPHRALVLRLNGTVEATDIKESQALIQ